MRIRPGATVASAPNFAAAVACDFATVDTVTLRRFYLLLFIGIPTRAVYLGVITEHPPEPGPPK